MGHLDSTELPPEAVAWATAHAAYPVVGFEPITGGYTRSKWLLRRTEGDPLVLRWTDPRRWGETGRRHVQREALACRMLAGSALPAPRLLISDPDGRDAGGPANLMTWLPGTVRLDPLSPTAITAWAELTAAVHRHPVPDADRPPTFTSRGPTDPQVPGWARWPNLWRRAIELWSAGPPPTPYGLLHRDFHLGNTLWQGDTVSGLIDWAETSWGPPDLDVAHACADFAMLHSTADAGAFRTAYVQAGGLLDPDPDAARFWVVSDIVGFLPDPAHILAAVGTGRPDLTPDAVRHGLEDLLVLTLV